jgi:hypothetical protein
MATLVSKFNRNEQVFCKHHGRIVSGVIISIKATLAPLQKEWWVFYDLQTGECSGVDHIPEEHLFRTREEAEADGKWDNHAVKYR